MTLANKITIFRILMVPYFIVEMLYYVNGGEERHRWLALGVFGLAAVLDGVDGFIARRFNQRSELGAILDPLADKLLLVSGVVLLSFDHRPYFERLPLWVTAMIVGRDMILVIGLIVIHYTFGRVRVQPRISGKIATVLQMVMVLWSLLSWDGVWREFWAESAGWFTGVSGLFYLLDGIKHLSTSPSSAADPKQ